VPPTSKESMAGIPPMSGRRRCSMARCNRLALGIGAAALMGCGSAPETIGSSPSDLQVLRTQLKTAEVNSHLRDLAVQMATHAGVPSPQTLRAVAATDHQAAVSFVSGAVIADHIPVYVVQMTGGPFTSPRRPPHAEAARGEVLTVIFDAVTHQVTDVGY